jgi:starvation-inducible DNA-binding protein
LLTQNYHWNLHGPEFYSLHLLFEKNYKQMAEDVDEIAERIRAIGFFVDASFGAFKNLSLIKGEEKVINIKEILLNLIDGHQTLIKHARNVAQIADNEGDFATVDMLGRGLGAQEKMLWMLRSQLG